MLATISDLHVTDGSTANNVHETAIKLLGDETESAANDRAGIEHVIPLANEAPRVSYVRRNGYPPVGGRVASSASKRSAAIARRLYALPHIKPQASPNQLPPDVHCP